MDELSAFDTALDLPEEGVQAKEEKVDEKPAEPALPPGPEFVDPEPEKETQDKDPEPKKDPVDEPPKTKPEPEQMVPLSRLNDEIDSRRLTEKRMDELMRVALVNRPTPDGEAGKSSEIEIDPDVEALVRPIVDQELQQLKPFLEEQKKQQKIDRGEELMPGFKDLWPKVEQEYAKLPEDLQSEFNTLGGALGLARMIQARDAEVKTPPANTEALARRAHSEDAPNPQRGSARSRLTAKDINAMSTEQFEAFKKAQIAPKGNDDEYDPLIR